MFQNFEREYRLTERGVNPSINGPEILRPLLSAYGGSTFEGGLYRIHDAASSATILEAVEEAFPKLHKPVICFGFDWLGRQFALDPTRGTPGDPEVLLLEPGTGEALEVPVTFSAFHDFGLSEFRDACLLPDFFSEWNAIVDNKEPAFNECVGYTLPLFLGGEDIVTNLELTNMDVYWAITSQLLRATRHLPPGTSISGTSMI